MKKTLFTYIALFCVIGQLSADQKINESTMPIIISHRGASAEAPENTLSAFKRAIELSSDFIEFDVQLTKDKIPVIFHDDDLSRITNNQCNLSVSDLTLKELQSLDVGSWFNKKFASERIPTLKQALELERGDVGLMIELKETKIDISGFVSRTLDILEPHLNEAQILIGSFSPEIIDEVNRQCPEISTIGITNDIENLRKHQELRSKVFVLKHTLIEKELVSSLHKEGKIVWTYTIDGPELIDKVLKAGVDGLITNNPKESISYTNGMSEG